MEKLHSCLNFKDVWRRTIILYTDADYFSFIEKKFKSSGITLEKPILEDILNLAARVPNNVQYLANRLWEYARGMDSLSNQDVKKCFNLILNEQNMMFYEIWELLSLNQRRLLIALLKLGGQEIYSSRFLQSSNLSLGTIQKSLKALLDHDILERTNEEVKIVDPFFAAWISKLNNGE